MYVSKQVATDIWVIVVLSIEQMVCVSPTHVRTTFNLLLLLLFVYKIQFLLYYFDNLILLYRSNNLINKHILYYRHAAATLN